MATELVLIRHGYAVRVRGDYVHAPITKLGQEQAALTGQFFSNALNHVDGFYCSPLRRTQETAAIIGKEIGQSAELRYGVQELDYREASILTVLEFLSIIGPLEDYLDRHAGKTIHWPIVGRVANVLLDLVAKHPGQRVAVVTHSGVISAALSWYFPKRRWKWWRLTVSNCSLTRLRVNAAQTELLAVNDIKHLAPAAVTTQPAAEPAELAKNVHPAAAPALPANPLEKT